MAVLAYLLPPLSGLVAYFGGRDARARFHGLQAIALGLLWPAVLWACSWVSPGATAAALAAGALAWASLALGAASGRTLRLPLLGRFLERAAAASPRGVR